MKVSVKTLKGSKFEIEVNPADKVRPLPPRLPICLSVAARVGLSGRDLGGWDIELPAGLGCWARFLRRGIGGVRGELVRRELCAARAMVPRIQSVVRLVGFCSGWSGEQMRSSSRLWSRRCVGYGCLANKVVWNL